MTPSRTEIKTNVIYGLVALVPIGVLLLLLAKLVEILEAIAKSLGLQSNTGAAIATLLGLLALLLVCFVVGALIRTQLGAWTFERFESTILQQIPGYQLIVGILKGIAGEKEAYPAALVQLFGPGTAVFALVIEEDDNGSMTVFVPSTPAVGVGTLHIVERERVTILEGSTIDVTRSVSEWGIGSQKIVSRTRS